MKKTLLLFSFTIISWTLIAQETLSISKEEVLSKVQQENNTLKIYEQDMFAAKGDFMHK